MINTEIILEFDKVKEKLADYACSTQAKDACHRLAPFLSETEAEAGLRDTTEGKLLIETFGMPPVSALEGVKEQVALARKGGCLSCRELEGIAGSLTAVKRMKDYLNRGKASQISLPYFEENLNPLSSLREELHQKIRNGQVDDYASKLLKTLRSEIEDLENKMREKADQVMRANKQCMSDTFSTMRNGHVCVPVKKEYKQKISGSVLDKSSTGNTLFIEPVQAAKYYDMLLLARLEEENEERRILYALTDMVAADSEIMAENCRIMEKLDFIFAKAKLSIEYRGTPPTLHTRRFIRLENGRHPLLNPESNVPLNFRIGGDTQGVIITGPNTGGKTVAIKTVALNCMMAQCGLHTASDHADICLCDRILCDIGDGQNLSENLSTFSAHITNVLDILKTAGPESLVIMDELGSGTDPAEGMGIAVAILEELKKSGALFLVTTHYPEVKQYAEKTPGIQNARMTFDKETLKPLYQLVLGEAGESCAFYIAEKLGMPQHMLAYARNAAYGGTSKPEHFSQASPASKEGNISALPEKSLLKKKKKAGGAHMLKEKFRIGDSVLIYPDKKIGIVCQPADEKGILVVQLPNKKIHINHKRVKLHVAAEKLYPADYDFSIVFDTVENRKLRHDMERKHVEGKSIQYEDFNC